MRKDQVVRFRIEPSLFAGWCLQTRAGDKKSSLWGAERAFLRLPLETRWRWRLEEPYLGGAGANVSRLRPGSGFGLGLGAFLTSFLPLSLLPMGRSLTQKGLGEKSAAANFYWHLRFLVAFRPLFRYDSKMCPREIPG
jgi:hypothetical protein